MRTSGVGLCCVLLTTQLAFATEGVSSSPPGSSRPGTSERDSSPASSRPAPADGLRVYVDPATGALVSQPSSAQRAALRDAIRKHGGVWPAVPTAQSPEDLNESDAGLTPFPVTGGVGLDLQGRFLSSLVLRRTSNGGFAVSCTDDGLEGSFQGIEAIPASPTSAKPEPAVR